VEDFFPFGVDSCDEDDKAGQDSENLRDVS